jgi:carboxyl-terminal processing protease
VKQIHNDKQTVRMPIILALTMASGILLGARFFGGNADFGRIDQNSSKFRQVLELIGTSYVDSVDTDSLTDFSIKKMLEKLDPHTSYYSTNDVAAARSQLESGFDGIGIEFNQFRDTVFVMTVLPGGPSEMAGLRPGDALLKVGTTSLTGPSTNNSLIFKTLRGSKGSEANIMVKRRGQKDLLNFIVKRDRIPSFSVTAGYLIDPQTGFIRVERFSESTHREFRNVLATLKSQGMRRLILDLRGNPGGYKDHAERMVDELVAGERLIVYTDGRGTAYDTRTYTHREGIFEKGGVIVLMDENSASASEIVAGAIQDNDRGLIVGRRSFGKGLVQMPVSLLDGSELRLTISRYYTPSGRCIQKPYTHNDEDEEYDNDYEKRLKSGELFKADSIKFDPKLRYKTTSGRVVYGGGGVTPDVFVPKDTLYLSNYMYELWGKNILREFALSHVEDQRKLLEKQGFKNFNQNFVVSDAALQELNQLAKTAGIKLNATDFERSKNYIRLQLKAYIARQMWTKRSQTNGLSNEYVQVMATADDVLQAALRHLDKADRMARGEVAAGQVKDK